MKDQEARDGIADLRKGQEAFRHELIAIVEAALGPVAMQASKAATDAARAGVQVVHLQEQLEVLAVEGNDQRVNVNALRETLAQQADALASLIAGLQALGSLRAVEPTNRQINRQSRRA